MLTPYQIRKDEEFDFDECSQLRSTIEKNRKKVKYFSKQMLVPKKAVLRKEEGATVAASHLPSLSWPLRCFVGPSGSKQKHPTHWERLKNYQKCPNYETKRETPAIYRHSF
jgi:hypothetical protein